MNRAGQAPPARRVLTFAQLAAGGSDVFEELAAREDLHLVRAVTLDAAERALREQAIGVLVVAADIPAAWVDRLVDAASGQPAPVPVLVLRARGEGEPSRWPTGAVAVLKLPLVPRALSRSVDAVLHLADPSGPPTLSS